MRTMRFGPVVVVVVWTAVTNVLLAAVVFQLQQMDVVVAWSSPSGTLPQQPWPHHHHHHHSRARSLSLLFHRATATRLYNTGGWGIGPQRELKPEEFVNGKGGGSSKYRRAASFEGYQLRDRGEFMRQVAVDKDSLQKGALDELLGVAASAGIQVKDPKERLDKFSSNDDGDDDGAYGETEYEDALDVSVQWDDEADATSTSNNNDENAPPSLGNRRTQNTESITRLDEDTGALGVW